MNQKRSITLTCVFVIFTLVAAGCSVAKPSLVPTAESVLSASTPETHDIDIMRAQACRTVACLTAAANDSRDIDIVRAQACRTGLCLLAYAPTTQDIDIVRAQACLTGSCLTAYAPVYHDIDVVRAQTCRDGTCLMAYAPNTQDIDFVRAQTCRTGACLMTAAMVTTEEKFDYDVDIKITIDPGDRCSIEGVDSINSGVLQYDLVVNNQAHEVYYFVLSTMDEGKTLADLQALPASYIDLPSYANIVLANYVHQGDFSHHMVTVTKGPLYISCFVIDRGVAKRIADLGPIAVIKE